MPDVRALSKLSKPTQRFLISLAEQGVVLPPITKSVVMEGADAHSRIADAIIRAGLRFGWWTKRRHSYTPTNVLKKFVEEIKIERLGSASGASETVFPKTSNGPQPHFSDLRLRVVQDQLRPVQSGPQVVQARHLSSETQDLSVSHGSNATQTAPAVTAAVSRNSGVSSTRAQAREVLFPSGITRKNIQDKTNTKKKDPVTESVSARSKASAKAGETRRVNKAERRKIIADRAKAVMAKEHSAPIRLTLQDEGEVAKAQAVALSYEKLLGLYKHDPTLRYLRQPVAPGQPAYGIWLRAAKLADEAGVDYSTFVKAQFYYMDQWYSRAPKPQEVASYKGEYPASKRAKTYVREIRDGNIESRKVICGRVRPKPKISQEAKNHQCEVQLKQFMRNFNASEEEIFLRFATKASARNYFDLNWLEHNTIYQRLRAAGRL